MTEWKVPPERLRKQAREALIVAFAGLLFLGIPFAFYLVPFLELGAMWRAQSADRQLIKQGQKGTITGMFAVPCGLLFFLISTVLVIARVAEMMDRTERSSSWEAPTVHTRVVVDAAANPRVTEYEAFIEADAKFAKISRPLRSTMSDRFEYRVDTAPHTLRLAENTVADQVEAAGLGLHLYWEQTTVRLDLENVAGDHTDQIAYRITTVPPLGSICHGARAGFDAIAMYSKLELQCGRKPIEIRIEKVETIKLPELSRYYLDLLPPSALGIDAKYANNHEGFRAWGLKEVTCKVDAPNAEWRDVVDFYARHRCQSYRFPDGYKAVTSADSDIPVVESHH
jgi:hypothetical protein